MADVVTGRLLQSLPRQRDAERFDTLLTHRGARFERIVSTGQTTPDSQWYDQAWDEWVMVVVGTAELQIEGEPRPRRLDAGDWLLLPAHVRHRVTGTGTPTVWLAIHFDEPASGDPRPLHQQDPDRDDGDACEIERP